MKGIDMTVIAKVTVQEIRQFGEIRSAHINCVCDDRLFTINTPVPGRVSENQTFNRASPWGTGQIALKGDAHLNERDELYLVFSRSAEGRLVERAIAGGPIRCVAITEFGGTSRHCEWSSSDRLKKYGQRGEVIAGGTDLDRFNLKMQIDNPHASLQFEAGSDDGWLHIFRADGVTVGEAVSLVDKAFTESSEDRVTGDITEKADLENV